MTDNSEVLATVARNQYVFKQVAPGRHVLEIETGREVVIEATAGETYYIKYAYTPSLIAMLSSVTFTQIPKDEAAKLLVQMTPADEQSAALAPPAPARIFIASSGNDQIVRIDDMTGTGWTTFGSRGSGANQFLGPAGIFVGAARKIFVTDSNNSRIVRIDDMTGAGWTTFGSFGDGANQFLGPASIFVDATGKIFVADAGKRRIVRMNDITGAA